MKDIGQKMNVTLIIDIFDILFYYKDSNKDICYLLNLFILLGKYFIHKMKFTKNFSLPLSLCLSLSLSHSVSLSHCCSTQFIFFIFFIYFVVIVLSSMC